MRRYKKAQRRLTVPRSTSDFSRPTVFLPFPSSDVQLRYSDVQFSTSHFPIPSSY